METNREYALVTGASRGLGKCLAIELAKRGINTILVALPNENIKAVAENSKQLGVDSIYFETDLSIKVNIINLAKMLNSRYAINILINNVGCGGTRSFIDCDVEYIDRIIQLNVMSTSILTHQILPNLMKQEKSYILNVSSMASFSPIGYKTVYPASKRFIQHFSRGLYQELKSTNVFVSVVHPGSMMTNEDVTNRIKLHGMLGKIGLLSPERVAEISIRRLFKRDTLILLGWMNKLNWLLMAIIPVWIKMPILSIAVKKELSLKLA